MLRRWRKRPLITNVQPGNYMGRRRKIDRATYPPRENNASWIPATLAYARRVSGLIGILSAVSFFAAVIFNSIVFARWRLSFLQLATPGDVIMTGLDFTVRSLPVLFGFYIGLAALAPFLRKRPLLYIFVIAVGAVVVWIGAAIMHLGFYPEVPIIGKLEMSLRDMIGVSSVFYGVLTGVHTRILDRSTVPEFFLPISTFSKIGVHLIPVVMIALTCVMVFGNVVVRGYFPAEVQIDSDVDGCRGRVLWRGEGAIVYRCEGDIRVVSGPDNITLRVENVFSLERRLHCLARCHVF